MSEKLPGEQDPPPQHLSRQAPASCSAMSILILFSQLALRSLLMHASIDRYDTCSCLPACIDDDVACVCASAGSHPVAGQAGTEELDPTGFQLSRAQLEQLGARALLLPPAATSL